MQEQPLVSIIIPTYNRAHLIGQTLDSVLAQTYENWECIVVDDGSTDDTAELLAYYVQKDSRFQYHMRPSNRPKGANACRNYGFELSEGEYINWLDSDDLFYPSKLELQQAILASYKSPFCVCQIEVYDYINKKSLGFKSKLLKSKDCFNDFIQFKIFWLTSCPLWDKKFLIKNRLKFNERLQQSQDYDFHIRVLSLNPKYSVTYLVLTRVNMHLDNMSNNFFESTDKVISNVKVRAEARFKYGELMTKSTKHFIFRQQYDFFREATLKKMKKASFYVFPFLIYSLFDLKITLYRKLKISLIWLIGVISYAVLKRGEVFLKPQVNNSVF
ncbi:glycosyltransferase family 2 protein [Leeuwenhoekiella sp. W20_SRS_FM14]|uniref:glycosyltransferase family 2 protein n=1 Tax=Leeuwenhoekiella sp. W20_SRS_FM14 TaxID=3240270 RepID=UPI003F9CC7C5